MTLGTKEFRGKHVCGGSIIGKNKILTAGHCLKNNSKYMVRIKVTIVLFIPFLFLVYGHFWQPSYKNMKILCNLCLHFARQDGQDGKKPERKSSN